MATKGIDLSQLFGSVVSTLSENQTTLNQADPYNHNHGDNMVEIFEVITQAMKEKSNSTPAAQLAYASKLLEGKSQSGSAKLYAEGLQDAAAKMKGKKTVTQSGAMDLLQALMGTQNTIPTQSLPRTTPAAADSGGDLLGSLLGGLTGEAHASSGSDQTGDLLGSLLGGLTGTTGESGQAQSGQMDISQLLKMGMTFMQAKQSGSSSLDAILTTVMSSSRMGSQDYRTQSGALVANSLLQALSRMGKK